MRQAPGDFAPGCRTLGRNHLGDVIEDHQPRVIRQLGAAHQQGEQILARLKLQFERILPMVALAGLGAVLIKTLTHGIGEGMQLRHFVEPAAPVVGQRQAQDAGGTRIDGDDLRLGIEDDHAGGQVVQNRLQIRACAFQISDAALDHRTRFGQLLGHVGKRPCQAAELVARAQYRFGGKIALRHLPHAIGQQQQRPCQLVAQCHGQQQRTEHGQNQHQRQRAEIHAPQAIALERALLVFDAGRLHSQGIDQHAGRHPLCHHQEALTQATGAQPHLGIGQQGQRADHCLALQGLGFVLQPFQVADDAGAAGLAQLVGSRSIGRQRAGVAADRKQNLAIAADQSDGACAELIAQTLKCQWLRHGRGLGHALGGIAGLACQVSDHAVKRAAAEVEAGVQRAGQAHIEPALDAAVDELVGHRVNHHPRHHADQRKNARQLEQQAAAELAAPDAQEQAQPGHADHQHQGQGDGNIDPEQPDIVAVEEPALAGVD